MERLRRRADFRAAAAGIRAAGRAFVLQARRRGDDGAARVGFTVSRQVGNAVERNRVRRRLREIVRLAAASALHAGHDYVLIGRRAALATSFAEMMREFAAALSRIHLPERQAHGGTGSAGERPLHEARPPAPPRPKSLRKLSRKPPNEH
ncbi:MAG TPA: ribonuclease P protein component [Xanthobacteraceae bacterium]